MLKLATLICSLTFRSLAVGQRQGRLLFRSGSTSSRVQLELLGLFLERSDSTGRWFGADRGNGIGSELGLVQSLDIDTLGFGLFDGELSESANPAQGRDHSLDYRGPDQYPLPFRRQRRHLLEQHR